MNATDTIYRLDLNTEYTITVTALNGAAESEKITNKTFKTPDITVRLEAESVNPLSPMSIVNETTASGGKYIWWDNNNVLTAFTPTDPLAVYNYTIFKEGTYSIWLKTFSPNPDGDSYFARIDGKDLSGGTGWTRVNLGPGTADPTNAVYGKWDWLPLNNANWTSVFSKQFTVGTHTLEICAREQRCKLDKIIIKEGVAKPTEN